MAYKDRIRICRKGESKKHPQKRVGAHAVAVHADLPVQRMDTGFSKCRSQLNSIQPTRARVPNLKSPRIRDLEVQVKALTRTNAEGSFMEW